MFYYTIYHAGRVIGGEFGDRALDALDRYAAGSTYDRNELTAKRGVRR